MIATIAMCHFRRIVMHYRKNHNSITGPTWKYPRYFKYLYLVLVFYAYKCHHRFSEFVDYVLGKDLRYDDEHWSPYFKECTPCHINFTFVGQSILVPKANLPPLQLDAFQATLRLCTGTSTYWQTKLALLNGTTRQ